MSGHKRGSIDIYINRYLNDDTSSVSSLSTAFTMLERSSSFGIDTCDHKLFNFDLTLLEDDDTTNSEEDTSPLHQPQQQNSSTPHWRWKSDPALPAIMDNKNADIPVIPLRRDSSKSSKKLSLEAEGSRKKQKNTKRRTTTPPPSMKSLLQRNLRMPRRQKSCDDKKQQLLPDLTAETTATATVTATPECINTKNKSPLRLNRFPMDLRIRRLSRASRIPTRRRSGTKTIIGN